MERIDPTAPDSDANWGTNDGSSTNGQDANGDPINGTPKAQNSLTASAPPPPPEPLHAFTLLAADEVTLQKYAFVEGDVHANDDVRLRKRSEVDGNVTASEEVTLQKDAEVSGDVTAPHVADQGAAVGGTVNEAAVAPVPLPDLPTMTPGTQDVEVPRGTTLDLPPGLYRDLELKKGAVLNLSHDGTTGDYHFRRVEIGRGAVVNLDAALGEINLFIEQELEFGKQSALYAFDGAEPTTEVTLWCGETGSLEIRRGSVVDGGTFIAPFAKVKVQKRVFFKGAICAREIGVQADATMVPHHSSRSAPKLVFAEHEEAPPVTNLPSEYTLEQNYPNPFNPTTTIRFALPEPTRVTVRIFNLRGQLVRTLADGHFEAGVHQVRWDGTSEHGTKVASGLYVFQLQSHRFKAFRTMLLLK